MTEQAECVEPPFARRHVQLTVAVITLAALIWLLISAWSASSRSERYRRLDAGALVPVAAGGKTSLIQIDLNTAEPRELALLPGVGPILARRIVENRDRLGPFGTVDDLSRVHGIGPKTLAEIEHICIVDLQGPAKEDDQRLASSSLDADDPDR
jgi:competence ComEA-like helix-hairpin-helix protein